MATYTEERPRTRDRSFRRIGFTKTWFLFMSVLIFAVYLSAALFEWSGETWRRILTTDGFIAAVAVSAYLLILLVARWLLIARPYREALNAEISVLRARLNAISDVDESWRQEAERLLEEAGTKLAQPDPFFWSWGDQKAASQLIAAAEGMATHALSPTEARHRLDVVLAEMGRYSKIDTQVPSLIQGFQASAQQLERERVPPGNGVCEESDEFQILHANALGVLHRLEISEFARILKWHRKVLWITVSGLILLVLLAVFLQNGELMIVGAAGAYLSRLTRIIRRADAQPEDVSSYWTNLLLGPLLGALAAYGGVLLLTVFNQLELAGSALSGVNFDLSADGVNITLTLSIAFAFGITEGLVNRIAGGVDTALTGKPDPSDISSSSTKTGVTS